MSASAQYPGPLAGTRVVEFAEGLAGPLTGMHLADMGAEVIRVERPGGDLWREVERTPGAPGRSRQHLQMNRGKRAVCIDLGRPEGRELAHGLVRGADVLVTNLRPGVPERLGIDAATCEGLNARLVHCTITGFGGEGPLAGRGGYALVVEALAGLVPLDDGGGDPRPAAAPVTDTAVPLVAVNGILAALLARGRTGRGQRVETSLLAAATALNAHALVRLEDAPPGRPALTPAFARAYRTADGWLAVAAYSDALARRLCAALGVPDLLDRPGLADPVERRAHSDAIAGELGAILGRRPTDEWEEILAAAGVPAGPLGTRDALLDHPQMRANGLSVRRRDDALGTVTMAGPPARLSDTPLEAGAPAGAVGADTRAVLRELGLDDARIDTLVRDGVIQTAP
jgi:crotonobetainyl-CoA:carnitine CoA-transferase CaiB-like acyl-CoA transferase